MRTRTVLKEPENGGKHCPSMLQKRECQRIACHDQRDQLIEKGKTYLKLFLIWTIALTTCLFGRLRASFTRKIV